MMQDHVESLAGLWQVRLMDGTQAEVQLPGTLDENGVGGPDQPGLGTRLTRLHVYTGPAVYTRQAVLACGDGQRLFLRVERSRQLHLAVDGIALQPRTGSMSTPWEWELTALADGSSHTLALTCDNSYPGWPAGQIIYSSAATDETQTNWNGLLGALELVRRPKVFAAHARLIMLPEEAYVLVTVDAPSDWQGTVRLHCDAFAADVQAECGVGPGASQVKLPVAISPDALRWDELEGRCYTMTVTLGETDSRSFPCGIRVFGTNDRGRLTLNGRAFFLRGEANCCVFPEAGHEPLTVQEWTQVLRTYMAYGVNTMRFHSHCPPEAAFTAADALGVMMQPELSHWDPKHALESEESYRCYRAELEQIILTLGCHPSFVMLSLGNELHCNEQGRERMAQLLSLARSMDPSRLYAWGSNNFYGARGAGECGGFFTASDCGKHMLRCTSSPMIGRLNQCPPATDYTFREGVEEIRSAYAGPMFGFEVGQYEVLPDFDEIDDFHGVTRAVNYELVRGRVLQRGVMDRWHDWVEATGEISLMCYREEVEASLRTEEMSGLSLLGLQDFPGQGTALVGMLNAHLQAKPYAFARPERFAAFFRPVLPLAMLPSRTFCTGEQPLIPVALANYGKEDLHGVMNWSLSGDGVSLDGCLADAVCPSGQVTQLGTITLPMNQWRHSTALTLTLTLGGHSNAYPLWVYQDEPVAIPEGVNLCQTLAEAMPLLEAGMRVLLTPPADPEHIPGAIASQFSTDFWSVGTFPQQSGAMGLLIDTAHPALDGFPTEKHTTWPWWPMSRGWAMLIPDGFEPVVRVMDSYRDLRSMALLGECLVGSGRLMFSGMGLMQQQDRVEVRALTRSLLAYMASDAFNPTQSLTAEQMKTIFG